MFTTINKYMMSIVNLLNLPLTSARSTSPSVAVDYEQQIRAEIHRLRLDATLAQLGAELPGYYVSNRLECAVEASFLFAQADRLERKLRYGID